MNLQENQTTSLIFPTKPLSDSKTATTGETNLEQEVFGNDGFSFKDLLDVINPLQHIPGISTVYRDLTGDDISPASRIGGSTLFFGPIGAAISTANVIIERATGKDIGSHVMAVFSNNKNDGALLTGAKPFEAGEDRINTVQLNSWTNPSRAIQTEENGLLNDKEYRSLVAKGEPFDLGIKAEQLAAAETEISDSDVVLLMSGGEPFADEGNTEIDLSLTKAVIPLLAQSTAQDAKNEASSLSRRTQAYASVGPEVLEWASREITHRSQAALAATQQPSQDLAGASAKGGGWFSEVMLTALKSYQGANDLSNSLITSGTDK
jgi:hypothetical protein